MRRLWPAIRLSAGLVSLCLSVMFIAGAMGLIPDRFSAILAGRKTLCESLAVNCSLAAQKNDLDLAEAALRAAVERNDDILSAGLRKAHGTLLFATPDHGKSWTPLEGATSTETQVQVEIRRDDELWGTLELQFAPAQAAFLARNSLSGFVTFVAVVCFLAFFLFLHPFFGGSVGSGPGAVPQRVKAALNSLAEGVIILDKRENIAMANQAFADMVGMKPEELQGKTVNDLPFLHSESQVGLDSPWSKAVQGEAQMGVVMGLQGDQAIPMRLSINSTPILGDDGSQRGALATFDNLTVLERKHAQLRKVLNRLRQSRRVVRRQNLELKALATRDPLTGCFNRRTLFAEFEKYWEASKRFQKPLACVMVDVDHFKSVNDRFGHSIGDEVLKGVAETLRKTARKTDLVCRYGGEEFCVLLPSLDVVEAGMAAERFRLAIEAQPLGGVAVTASLGVSAIGLGAKHPQELLEQADKALYAAKRSGRNRFMRFDQAPANLLSSHEMKKPEAPKTTNRPPTNPAMGEGISFQAVSGLLAALAYRHAETAEHCKRVADLCVQAGGGLMSRKELYILEMAALLHDIGKLGVPDDVLLKAGPLTTEEWKLLRMHESIGVEIIRTAFTSEELAEIVHLKHCWYGGTPTDHALPKGPKIPVGARLLAVADAFDSMINDQIYRKALPRVEAFEELRRCAGTQFDPVLVESFIAALSEDAPKPNRTPAPMAISKRAAFKIGVQIEKLAMAADVQDVASLTAMAGQLKAMAQESNIPEIAEVAAKLEDSATRNSNEMDLMELTIDLLELCRQTQRSLLPAVEKPRKSRPKTMGEFKLENPTPLTVERPPQFSKKGLDLPQRPPSS